MELIYRLEKINEAAADVLKEIGVRSIITFNGEMGAGKTTFIHALCRQMGVSETMGSPTFSIINEYEGAKGPVFHIDLYRCKNEDEAIRAGVEDCIYSGCVCLVEWPSKAPSLFPEETIQVSIAETVDKTRKITVT